MINLDPWQTEILNTTGNILLCSGRQVGKSLIISEQSVEYAIKNSNKTILILSSTERQAYQLFLKCLNYTEEKYRNYIKRGKDKPTQHFLRLKNGSTIMSFPCGLAGTGVRGYSLSRLIIDEAAYVEDAVFYSLTPSLLTTGGDIVLVSTPRGKKGFFWEMTKDQSFKVFNIDSEKVIRERAFSSTWSEKQREDALAHVEREKKRMSKRVFLQEYCGHFIDELTDYFPEELIRRTCVIKRSEVHKTDKTYLGVDIARLGSDSSSFTILARYSRILIKQVENITTSKTRLNETFDKIRELDNVYNFKSIGIDSGGIGSGVSDFLIADPKLGDKTKELNNLSREINPDGSKKKAILKENLYSNLLMLMERGEIQLLDDDELIFSLQSVKYEYAVSENMTTTLKIFTSPHTDIIESITRAAWLAKDKDLNLWAAWR